MELNQIAQHGQYVRYLRENPAELQALLPPVIAALERLASDHPHLDLAGAIVRHFDGPVIQARDGDLFTVPEEAS